MVHNVEEQPLIAHLSVSNARRDEETPSHDYTPAITSSAERDRVVIAPVSPRRGKQTTIKWQ